MERRYLVPRSHHDQWVVSSEVVPEHSDPHVRARVDEEISIGPRSSYSIQAASPTGGLDPITSTTIIELVIKQRDVYRTSSLLVTHRLQDAFTLVSHRFNREAGKMEPLPEGQTDPQTSFLMLSDGKLVFDGSTHDLVHSDDPFIKEYLS